MNKKFSILIILTVTNFIGFLLLLYNQDKNLKTLQKLTEQTKIENQLAFAQLQSYLEDNFLEQNKIIETTNRIAVKNKKAQAEQTEIISNDMTEGLSLMEKKKYEQAMQIFNKVCQLQPYNSEAKFYSIYALFLKNKLDTANYKLITETISSLRGAGYNRNEMTEIEDFIKCELKSMSM